MTHEQIQAAVDRACEKIARQKGSTTTRDFLAMACLLGELNLVKEPQPPLSATRIARDESAAQKNIPSNSPISVAQAREKAWQEVADTIADLSTATEFEQRAVLVVKLTKRIDRYTDAIRAESFKEREDAAQVIERYVAAGDQAVTAMRGLEAQIAALKAELRNVGRTLRDLGWDGLKDREVARGRHEKGL